MNIFELLNTNLNELLDMADKVRENNVGNIIHIRSLLEISNICLRNCEYCGLRCDNNNLKRYALSVQEIEALGKKAFDIGYKTIVLQSGESLHYNVYEFAEMVAKLTDYGIVVTLSLGELPYEQLKVLKEAGAQRYLLKFETADKALYEKLHKGYTLQRRLECLSNIKNLGYQVGSGFLVGLPEENEASIVKNLKLLKEFECDMAGIGVFIPHQNTPLANCNCGSAEITKKCVAITRLLLPKCNIPITTSLGEFEGGYNMFNGGANVIMQNITPHKVAKNYQIYPKQFKQVDMQSDWQKLTSDIKEMGKIPV